MNHILKLAQKYQSNISDKEGTIKLMNSYLGSLRALSILHQVTHWIATGPDFYQTHLLTDRLYNETLKHIDDVGEKVIGLFGPKAISYESHAATCFEFIQKHSQNTSNKLELLLAAEKEFLDVSNSTYSTLEQSNHLSLGLDDLLSSIASAHESFVYLLNSSLSGQEVVVLEPEVVDADF